MGKRLIAQRRGRGTNRYRANSHLHKGKAKHPSINNETKSAKVTEFVKCIGHTAPLARVKFEDGGAGMIIAPENLAVGDAVNFGNSAPVNTGNVLALKNIPDGTFIYNIESQPGDGGKFARASGTFAKLLGKVGDKINVVFPSKKRKSFNPDCRASIGIAAGGGRHEKPFVKAGTKFHLMMRKGRLYPRTSAVAMNAVDHPFGSGRGRHVGKTKIAPRDAPPGRKVGLVRPRRTGRKTR